MIIEETLIYVHAVVKNGGVWSIEPVEYTCGIACPCPELTIEGFLLGFFVCILTVFVYRRIKNENGA